MQVTSVNAESKLINIASTIGRSPQSWYGWFCLKISLDNISINAQQESLFLVKSLISSYLHGSRGKIFFCENSAIHIIVNSVKQDMLEYAGQQICDLSQHENAIDISYSIYNLAQCGQIYAQEVINQLDGLLKHTNQQSDFFDKEDYFSIPHEPNQENIKTHNISTDNSKVLLVEDDPVTRWLVRQTLRNHCDFATAQTANRAFNLYISYQPDVVFLDINLPDKNGYEVLEWIMRNDPGANVVMFSSQSHMDNITNALDVGASAFIGKPFVKQQLLDCIHGSA